MQRNRLADETSPYLQQHAGNPVDWYPWGEEALDAARAADKPILLSIGYSACHWCHVMAHESFEDPATAALMNELFVNVKVDREERPDLDRIYQAAQQLITQGHGGWPLTMFLTPGQTPFFGGTYFPKQARHGMPPFGEILKRVAQYYRDHAAEIGRQHGEITAALAALEPGPAAGDTLLDSAPLAAGRAALERSFDAEHGGFGRAPKFPHATGIERCLRHWRRSAGGEAPDLKALYMATLSLSRMAEGGLYDQLGGGFARYSVDAEWRIPHFEKMLYDNGALLAEYARAYLATGEPAFAAVAAETADWVLRDMRSPEGGFYSSLDADSEGHEGRFYLWTRAEVEELLSPREWAIFSRRYGLDGGPNFEGRWHLYVARTLEDSAGLGEVRPDATDEALPTRQKAAPGDRHPGLGETLGAPPSDARDGSETKALEVAEALLAGARAKLLAARNLRVWPGRDEKILTSWNALVIKGLALAGRILRREDLIAAAAAAIDFIRRHLWRDGRLLATYKDGRARLPAYLDDHAFLLDALLEMLQSRWRSEDLALACELAELLLAQFEDAPAEGGRGGFFFTARDHERLIHRGKSFADESIPAGNGIAAAALCRLGHLLAEPRHLDAAERTLRAAWPMLEQHPMGHMSALNALEDFMAPLELVVIRGEPGEMLRWSRELGRLYAPTRMIVAIPADAAPLPPALASKAAAPSGTIAYVCRGMSCSAPEPDLARLARRLADGIETGS